MSVTNMEQKDVVSICDPKILVVEWRDIPGYANYEACSLGLIRNKRKQKILSLCEVPTSVGTYLRSSAVSDDWRYRSNGVHNLVCLAFHGGPPDDGQKYEVNHINGNKHCNYPSNLEWLTRSQNLTHAYETGLRTDNVPVDVIDITTGETVRYYSTAEFSRWLGVTPSQGSDLTHKHRTKPYKGTYLFVVDLTRHVTPKHAHIREVQALEYVTRKVIVANDCGTLAYLTGIQPGTISWNLREGRLQLVGGFVFKYLDDKTEWPVFDDLEVTDSISKHAEKTEPRAKRYGITVRNYIADTITEYKTTMDATLATNTAKGTIAYLLTLPQLKLFRGYVFKYSDDPRPFPSYDRDIVEVSLSVKKPEFPPIRATDIVTNTSKLYPSLTEFARANNIPTHQPIEWFKRADGTPFHGRWTMVRVPL